MSFIPDFFVIGAMKAGTTTMYNSVLKHPNICLTKTKEVNYFLRDIDTKALNSLYENQFVSPSLLKGDVSPSYSKAHLFPGVAKRMYEANPQAKIIFIARDPYDRLLSHLQHNLLRDRYSSRRVENEIKLNNDYLLTSSYFYQLSYYLDFFKREQILILLFEDLKNKPEHFTNTLSQFLNLDGIRISDDKFYSSEARYKIKYFDIIHSTFGETFITKLYHYFWYFCNIKEGRPYLQEELKNYLIRELNKDVRKFSGQFNIDVSTWGNFSTLTDITLK